MADLKAAVDKVIANFAIISNATLISGVDQQKFRVVRKLIGQSSEYVGAMFRPNSAEVTLPGIDGPTLKSVIGFIYSGLIEINDVNIEKIMQAASSMRISSLRQHCNRVLGERLTLGNCVRTLEMAEKFVFTNLKAQALQLLTKNVDKISMDNILELNETHFGEILKRDDLPGSEIHIFNCLEKWVDHKSEVRSISMPRLLPLIRLNLLPGSFLFALAKPLFETHGLAHLIQEECERSRLEIVPVSQMRCLASATMKRSLSSDQSAEQPPPKKGSRRTSATHNVSMRSKQQS